MGCLGCLHCGYGIRYTGPANGTEYLMLEINEWKRLIKTDMLVVSYDEEGTNEYHYLWKCPRCGTFSLFEHDWHKAKNVLAPCSFDVFEFEAGDEFTDYIMIVDLYYEDMYERDATGADLEQFGDFGTYVRLGNKGMKIYKDETMTQLLACFINEPIEK